MKSPVFKVHTKVWRPPGPVRMLWIFCHYDTSIKENFNTSLKKQMRKQIEGEEIVFSSPLLLQVPAPSCCPDICTWLQSSQVHCLCHIPSPSLLQNALLLNYQNHPQLFPFSPPPIPLLSQPQLFRCHSLSICLPPHSAHHNCSSVSNTLWGLLQPILHITVRKICKILSHGSWHLPDESL